MTGRALLILLLALPGLAAEMKTKTASRPKVTALVCTASVWGVKEGEPEVTVVGGPVKGKGWVDSEKAQGILGKGTKLSLYALEAGPIGELVLSSSGRLGSREPGPPETRSLSFLSRATPLPGKEAVFVKAWAARSEPSNDLTATDLVAAWTSDGGPPTWVTGDVLPRQALRESKYHTIIAQWLRAKGVPPGQVDHAEIVQVVRVDLDRDGRKEEFLSVNNGLGYTESGHSDRQFFSYLLIRRAKAGAKQAEVVVLDDTPWWFMRVVGFCDLDHDGCAEIVVSINGIDYMGAALFRWDGHRLLKLDGWSSGV